MTTQPEPTTQAGKHAERVWHADIAAVQGDTFETRHKHRLEASALLAAIEAEARAAARAEALVWEKQANVYAQQALDAEAERDTLAAENAALLEALEQAADTLDQHNLGSEPERRILANLPAAAQEWEQQKRDEIIDSIISGATPISTERIVNQWLASPDGQEHDKQIRADERAKDGHGDHPRDAYLYEGCPRCGQYREQAIAGIEPQLIGAIANVLRMRDVAWPTRTARVILAALAAAAGKEGT